MTKKTLHIGGECTKELTPAERDVLRYLTQNHWTVKQIMVKRECSHQAVYQIINNLKKKGALSRAYKSTLNKQGCGMQGNGHQIRCHAHQWDITILERSKSYNRRINTPDHIDGCSLFYYSNKIEVWGLKSFYGRDEQQAFRESIHYYERLFRRIESECKILLIKPKYNNIRMVKCHFAEVNNEMAHDIETTGEKLHVYAREDGKLWFIIDNSFNLHEAETQHRYTGKRDMSRVRKQLNDWREKNPPTLSELANNIQVIQEQLILLAKENRETAAGVKCIIELLKPTANQASNNNMTMPEYIG